MGSIRPWDGCLLLDSDCRNRSAWQFFALCHRSLSGMRFPSGLSSPRFSWLGLPCLEFANFSTPSLLTISVAVHTFGYLLVTGLVAMLVYEKLGVGMLRRAWFNVDLFWMLALIATGVFILFL